MCLVHDEELMKFDLSNREDVAVRRGKVDGSQKWVADVGEMEVVDDMDQAVGYVVCLCRDSFIHLTFATTSIVLSKTAYHIVHHISKRVVLGRR